MTKHDLVVKLARATRRSQAETKTVVQMVLDGLVEGLLADRRVELRNFGVFELRRRAGRKARNPRTGETIMIPPRDAVVFRPGMRVQRMLRAEAAGTPDAAGSADTGTPASRFTTEDTEHTKNDHT